MATDNFALQDLNISSGLIIINFVLPVCVFFYSQNEGSLGLRFMNHQGPWF